MSNSVQGSKTSALHLGLFALSLVGEINTIRKQYNSNDRKLIYLSSTLSQLELLCELYFGHVNEKIEPLIYFFEAIKALLKLKEYVGLITKEKMGCYISKELYEVHKKDEEKKKSMVMLPRSKKCLPKPDNFPLSNKMMKYALKSKNSVDSLQSLEESQLVKNPNRFGNVLIKNEGEEESAKKNMLSVFTSYLSKKFKYFRKLINSRKFKISEIILILRPFLYMYYLLKYGTKSYKPFLLSLAIEVFGIFIGTMKMANCKTDTEREELAGRWKGLAKYFLKEPFYSQYTVRIVYTLLCRIINDRKIGFVLSILTYFKYYSYIV